MPPEERRDLSDGLPVLDGAPLVDQEGHQLAGLRGLDGHEGAELLDVAVMITEKVRSKRGGKGA